MSKIPDSEICRRIARLRVEAAGPRGKSAFARQLGLSPSTYDYYEAARVPPADVLVRISELTGADLRWLLTGQGSPAGGVTGAHPVVRRAAALLADHPDAAAPLAAFLELLAEAGKFPAKPADQPADAGAGDLAEDLPPAAGRQRVPPREGEHQAEMRQQAAASWIPILGRSAAGVAHFWASQADSVGLTTLDQLVQRHAARAASSIQHATAEGAECGQDTPVQVITLSAPQSAGAGEVAEFISAPQIKVRYPDAFALRIDGDSMAPEIRHGDLVVLSPRAAALDGRAAVIQLKGQIGVTCKLIRREGQATHLVPVNENYDIATVGADQLLWALRVLARIRS